MRSDLSETGCIICGVDNPIGLHLAFSADDNGSSVEATVGPNWQGYRTMVHGGIVAGLLDDAMWHAIYHRTAERTVTAELMVRYKRPVPVGSSLTIRGRVERATSRLVVASGEIRSESGEVLAVAEGRFMPLGREVRLSRHVGE